MTIKDVVPQHQRARAIFEELLAQQESLSYALRFRLHLVLQANPELTSIPQQGLELGYILGCGDNQYFSYSRQHQRAERVVNHRLVVDGKKALSHRLRDRIESRPGPSRQNDAFVLRARVHVG